MPVYKTFFLNNSIISNNIFIFSKISGQIYKNIYGFLIIFPKLSLFFYIPGTYRSICE